MMNPKRQLVLALLPLVIATALASHASAQRIRIQEGPYYVGEPVTMQVVVKSDGEEPSVKHVGKTAGITVRGPQVQATSSGTVIVNGRVIQSDTEYVYQFSVVSSEPGTKTVGPFEITVDGKTTTTDTVDFDFEQLEDSPDMFLKLTTDTQRAYVGQTIPITIQWAYSAPLSKVRHAFSRLRITSALFDEFELQIDEAQSENTLVLESGDTAAEVGSEITEQRIDGRNYVVATAQLSARCTSPGNFVIASRCRSQELLSRGGFFESARVRPMVATAESFSLEVLPIPSGGPSTFAGAVGEDFTITTRLQRTQARVGDPIQLTVTLRGKIGVDSLRLPDWSQTPLAEQFQFPSERPTGQVTGDGKRFEMTIRAKEAGITNLPPLEFSWFDPSSESFKTTKSKPLPLEIATSELVSSSSVFSAAGQQPAQSEQSSTRPQDLGSTLPANLAIDRDISVLTQTHSPLSAITIKTLYGSAIGLVALALLWRTRSAISPAERRSSSSGRRLKTQLTSATGLPPAEAAGRIAASLREYLQADPSIADSMRHEIDSLLSECDAIAFSPTPNSDTAKLESLSKLAQQIVSDTK